MPHRHHFYRTSLHLLALAGVGVAIALFVLPFVVPPPAYHSALGIEVACGVVLALLIARRNQQAPRLNASAAQAAFDARRERQRLTAGVLLAVALGLAFTSYAVQSKFTSIARETRARFDRITERTALDVRHKVDQPVYGLKGARGVFAASTSVERAEFAQYVISRDLAAEFPGAQGFGCIERVRRENLPAFIETERRDDAPDFDVHASALQRAGDTVYDELYVVKYLYPPTASEGDWGLDMGSHPVCREAILRAVASGEPTVSRRVTLRCAGGSRTGFYYFLPFFRRGADPQTPEQRTQQLQGLIFTPVVLEDTLAELTVAAQEGLDFEIYDGPDVVPENCLMDLDCGIVDVNGALRPPGSPAPSLTASTTLSVGGRTWTLITSTTAHFDAHVDHTTPWAIGAVGAALTFLLAASIWSLGISRSRAIEMARDMTVELKAGEEAARAAARKSERLAEIARRTSNAVIITDAQGIIQWVNEGFTRITGYTFQQALGNKPGELLQGPGSDPAAAALMRTAVRLGQPVTTEILNYSRTGAAYRVKIEITPLHDPAGQISGFMAIESDITAQHEAQCRLRESESTLQEMGRVASIGGWSLDVDANALTWTDVTRLIHEVPAEYVPSVRSGIEFYAPAARPLIEAALQRALTHGEPWDLELPLVTAAGNAIWVRTVGQAERHDGRTVRVCGACQDITVRKRAQDALAQREEAYRTLFETVPAAVYVCDTNAVLRQFNARAAELWGRTPQVGVDRYSGALRLFLPGGEPLPHDKTPVVDVLRTGVPARSVELLIERPDGTRLPVIANYAALRDSTGGIVGTVVSFDDITARKRAEAQTLAARLAAESANLAKSAFLANMSHEIRTPLTAILGFADVLREEGDLRRAPSHRLQAIDTIRHAGAHLLSVINDILDLSKIEAQKMTVERIDTPLVRVIREVESLVRPRAVDKGLFFNTTLTSPVPEHVISDPTRLRQILMNLAGNAVKFTDAGTVSVDIAALGDGDDARLVIDVNDTGPGMTPEQVARLFKPFGQGDATVTRKHGGTGLGLTICQRLAALIGGTVVLARTTPGVGSSFRVDLPLQPVAGSPLISSLDAVKPDRDPSIPRATPVLHGRILLAEDGVDNQRLICFHLRNAGATVDIAENGRLALEMIQAAQAAGTPYHLLLTDMQMPEMDGYALTRALRARGSTLPIVAITAHAMAEDHERCAQAGCDDYASKPIDKSALLSLCASWLGKSSSFRVAA